MIPTFFTFIFSQSKEAEQTVSLFFFLSLKKQQQYDEYEVFSMWNVAQEKTSYREMSYLTGIGHDLQVGNSQSSDV